MLIVCPSCASEYTIDPEQIGAEGRTVRCAECRETWFVAPEIGDEPEDPAELEAFNAFLSAQGPARPEPPAPAALEVEATSGPAPEEPSPAVRPRTASNSPAKSRLSLRLPAAPALVILCIAVAATLVLARVTVVRALPQTARLYDAVGLPVNLRSLEIKNVRSELVLATDDKLLVIEGEVLNPTGREMPVPLLEFAVRSGDGRTLYTWTNEVPRKTLGSSEAARFRARLTSPPGEGRQVLVRFATAVENASLAAKAR